jgi:streptomycin 6-kinase
MSTCHVAGLTLPSNLAARIEADRNPARDDWLRRLPGVIADLARQWELTLGSPFQPGGACAWVAPARTARGERLVLKVGWLHPEAVGEPQVLRLWDGNGAVRLHAADERADTVAMLLELCEPGTQLAELPEPEQDGVVCGLLRRLWREPPAGHEFPSLQSMCASWAAEFEADSAQASRLDPGIVRAGLELFRLLPASADRQVVLATDLHAQNILAARREPWLAVDPKPHVGDPVYDVLQHMINCDRLSADPVGLAGRIANLLDLDLDRLLHWLFARSVQNSPERPALADVAVRLAP